MTYFLASVAIVSLLLMLPINALAQTDNSTNMIQTMNKIGKIMNNVTTAINNLNKTMTSEDCMKTRQLYPTSHNVTVFGNMSFNPLDIALKACKEAGK